VTKEKPNESANDATPKFNIFYTQNFGLEMGFLSNMDDCKHRSNGRRKSGIGEIH